MNKSRLLFAITLICVGVVSRFLPHPPNFTAINSIALFGVWSLKCHIPHLSQKNQLDAGIIAVFVAMCISDYFIGFHATLPFVYLSFAGVILLGYRFSSEKIVSCLPLFSVASSLLFFLLVNFGVWLTTSLYPKTVTGLIICYIAAIPFLTSQILGDLVYGTAMFGSFVLAEKYIPYNRNKFKIVYR